MGIAYRGSMCVGYTYEQVEQLIDKSDFAGSVYDFSEEEGLVSFSPYFDADLDDCVFGYQIAGSSDYSHAEVDLEKLVSVGRHMKDGLLIEYGIEPKVYIMAHGS